MFGNNARQFAISLLKQPKRKNKQMSPLLLKNGRGWN